MQPEIPDRRATTLNSITDFVASRERRLMPYVVIVLIGLAGYGTALYFVPGDLGDLVVLSAVARTDNPIAYFWSDWLWGNGAMYRPLPALSLWLGYQVFGVAAFPNQLINLALHILVVCLLFRFVSSVQKDRVLAFLFACLSLFSLYAISPATWVSDRPTLFAAMFLLLLLGSLYQSGRPREASLALIATLCILALLSKESGLVAPIFLVYFAAVSKTLSSAYRKKVRAIAVGLIVVYLGLRFGVWSTSGNLEYALQPDTGYILGTRRYESLDELPGALRWYAPIENVLKNVVAPFFPVFDPSGGLSLKALVVNSGFWLVMPVLVALSIGGGWSELQKAALAIVVINAVIHYSLFRYRTLYLSQLAVWILLSTAPTMCAKATIRVASKICALVLVVFSIFTVSRSLHSTAITRYERIHSQLDQMLESPEARRIDSRTLDDILRMYGRPSAQPARASSADHAGEVGAEEIAHRYGESSRLDG